MAAWLVETSPEATLNTLQQALTIQATKVETIIVYHAIRLLRQVAERQSMRAAEEGFRLKRQQDLEDHASFAHKVVSGKAQPVQLPTDALHGATTASTTVVTSVAECPTAGY